MFLLINAMFRCDFVCLSANVFLQSHLPTAIVDMTSDGGVD